MTSPFTFIKVFVLSVAFATCSSLVHAQAPAGMGAPRGPQILDPLVHNLSEVKSGTYELEHDHGRIIWTANHHGFSMFSAVFPTVYATLEFDAKNPTNSKLSATVDMTKVATQIPVFDERANSERWLNTGKYPTSTFTSTKMVMAGKNSMAVTGDLTFLGVTKPAVMNVKFIQAGNMQPPGGGYRIGFNGTMAINRSDWGMPLSTVGDEITMLLEAEFLEPGAEH